MVKSYVLEAARFLDYYLDDAVEAEYAVMLSAPWGAGKTHFIKKYLEERSRRTFSDEGVCYLYASLYGITSTSAINDQFFAQLHPHLTSKASRLIGTIAGSLAEKFAGAKNSGQIFQDLVLKLEGKVLVIDDLERCSMKIPDVMGFINTLVEHERLKVIILVNEEEIPAGQRDEYARQKEKLIGKTITVKADPGEVLEKLRSGLSSSTAREVVEREQSALLSTFTASGKPNFRNLRAVLGDYERLIEAIDPRLKGKPEALKQLLLYMIATGSESRTGTLTKETLQGLPTTRFAVARIGAQGAKGAGEQPFELLASRYPDVQWTDPIVGPHHLSELFFTGNIEVSEINDILARHPEVVGHAEVPAWRLLWNWTQLSKTEYDIAAPELVRALAEGRYTDPGEILHSAGIILTLREYGDQLLGQGVEVVSYFAGYVSKQLEQNTLKPNKGAFGFDGTGSAGLGYSSFSSPEFQAIYSVVKLACEEMGRRRMAQVADCYIARLRDDPSSYPSLYEYGLEDGNYGGIAFLQHIQAADFANLLIIDSCSNDHLFASLIKRFEHDHPVRNALLDEYDWTDELRKQLLVIVDAEVAPFGEMLRQRVNYYFGKIAEGIGRSLPSD